VDNITAVDYIPHKVL